MSAIVSALNRALVVPAAFLLLLLLAGPGYAAGSVTDTIDPVAYLNLNEGSGITAYDLSGHGNAGTLHNVTRVENGGCGNALFFDGIDNYVSIPYRSSNHPEKEITVSAWFYAAASGPQDIISTCYGNGGYCLGFGDGDDLWWTVSTPGEGPVSINVQHEGIAPGEWHHVAGIYDGKTTRVYLDGVLRNQRNASGPLVYEYPNYVILGANAGSFDTPGPACPRYFHGGLDEVRIYDRAVPYTQIMDDRFRCTAERVLPRQPDTSLPVIVPSCYAPSGSLSPAPGGTEERILRFSGRDVTGTWKVSVPPGSKLTVMAKDRYSSADPDSWYIEIADEGGRVDRTIIFPNTRNTPVDGEIMSGNATVTVRYFDGPGRFPASVAVAFSAAPPLTKAPEPPKTILNYPIIVIYSASWATLIALIVVFLWLHKRRSDRKKAVGEQEERSAGEERKEN